MNGRQSRSFIHRACTLYLLNKSVFILDCNDDDEQIFLPLRTRLGCGTRFEFSCSDAVYLVSFLFAVCSTCVESRHLMCLSYLATNGKQIIVQKVFQRFFRSEVTRTNLIASCLPIFDSLVVFQFIILKVLFHFSRVLEVIVMLTKYERKCISAKITAIFPNSCV